MDEAERLGLSDHTSFVSFGQFDSESDTMVLDGSFTIEDLRKIIAYLEAKNG